MSRLLVRQLIAELQTLPADHYVYLGVDGGVAAEGARLVQDGGRMLVTILPYVSLPPLPSGVSLFANLCRLADAVWALGKAEETQRPALARALKNASSGIHEMLTRWKNRKGDLPPENGT